MPRTATYKPQELRQNESRYRFEYCDNGVRVGKMFYPSQPEAIMQQMRQLGLGPRMQQRYLDDCAYALAGLDAAAAEAAGAMLRRLVDLLHGLDATAAEVERQPQPTLADAPSLPASAPTIEPPPAAAGYHQQAKNSLYCTTTAEGLGAMRQQTPYEQPLPYPAACAFRLNVGILRTLRQYNYSQNITASPSRPPSNDISAAVRHLEADMSQNGLILTDNDGTLLRIFGLVDSKKPFHPLPWVGRLSQLAHFIHSLTCCPNEHGVEIDLLNARSDKWVQTSLLFCDRNDKAINPSHLGDYSKSIKYDLQYPVDICLNKLLCRQPPQRPRR